MNFHKYMLSHHVDILSFIYESKMSIPDTLCEEIIQNFDNQPHGKYDGLTVGGVNKNIKDTTDLIIPYKSDDWSKINTFLHKELNKHLQKYISKINVDAYYPNNNNDEDGSILQIPNYMLTVLWFKNIINNVANILIIMIFEWMVIDIE